MVSSVRAVVAVALFAAAFVSLGHASAQQKPEELAQQSSEAWLALTDGGKYILVDPNSRGRPNEHSVIRYFRRHDDAKEFCSCCGHFRLSTPKDPPVRLEPFPIL